MDMSKLPKMGASSTANDAANDDPAAPAIAAGTITTPVSAGDLLSECLIAALIGGIFLMLGQHFGGWLMHGGHYDTGVIWNDGINVGQPVKYFDLQGGTAWLEMGEFVLGLCLLIEAALTGVGLLTRRFGRAMATTCLLLGAIGAAANILAIVMQIQAGFTQPFMSMVALAVGVLTSLVHGRRVLT